MVTTPVRQGDVPSVPEVLQISRKQREIEILGDWNAKEPAQGDCYVTVACEIKIDIK